MSPSLVTSLLAATLITAAALGAVGCGLEHRESPAGGEPALPTPSAANEAEPGWLRSVTARIRASAYRIAANPDGALATSNPDHGLRAEWRADISIATGAGGRVVLRAAAVGRGALRASRPRAEFALGNCQSKGEVDAYGQCLRRAEATHGGMVEWWENRPGGLEQGFTIERPLGQVRDGHVAIDVSVDGAGIAIDDDLLGATLTSAGGARLRYDHLVAWDANHRPLAARMTARANVISLEIDDAGARYPITIDPMVSVDPTALSAVPAMTISTDNVYRPNPYYSYAYPLSVASAGDVDGDGYGDVIVGAGAVGRAYLYRGSSSGLSGTAAVWNPTDGGANGFGLSVAAAGDVNDDGCGDVIVAAPWHGINGDAGKVHLYLGRGVGCLAPPSVAPLADTAAWTVAGADYSMFGASIASAGDVNDDGHSDVLVGAPGYAPSPTDYANGAAFLYLGTATGLAPTAAWTYVGAREAELGTAVAGAGDVNSDGYSDILVGAPGGGNGKVVLFLGETTQSVVGQIDAGTTGVAAVPSWTVSATASGTGFGRSVAGAGDVNGDGFADVIIGEPETTPSIGTAFAFLGGASPSTSPAWSVVIDELSGVVAPAGDVNGDGYADVIVGAQGGSGLGPGTAAVYLGSSAGLLAEASWTADGGSGELLGASVAGAGDVNGDGITEVLVGNGLDPAQAFLYVGRIGNVKETAKAAEEAATWWAEGNIIGANIGRSSALADFNGDGFDDLAVGGYASTSAVGTSTTDVYVLPAVAGALAEQDRGNSEPYRDIGSGVSSAVTLASPLAGAGFGVVADAGDVNGDGYADLVVGSVSTPGAWLYLGSATGLSTNRRVELNAPQGALSFGSSVAGAGDVDGDGYADVLVGDYGAKAVYVFAGRSSSETDWSPAQTLEGTASGDAFAGETAEQIGRVLASAGDVNGDGYGDVAVVAASPATCGTAIVDGNGSTYYSCSMGGARVYVFHGSVLGLASSPARSFDVGGSGGAQGGDCSVADRSLTAASVGRGDFNGDGYSDMVIGAPWYQTCTGNVNVYAGGSGGLSATALTTHTGANDVGDDNNNPSGGPTPDINVGFGSAVASGDVDGDGHIDLLVASVYEDDASTPVDTKNYYRERGRVTLFRGGEAGPSASHTWFAGQKHSATGTYFGRGNLAVGDVNGDGLADFAASKSRTKSVQGPTGSVSSAVGAVYLFTGNSAAGTSPRSLGVYARDPITQGRIASGSKASGNTFAVVASAPSVIGRTPARLHVEVTPLGASTGTTTAIASDWIATSGSAGLAPPIAVTTPALAAGARYTYRARWEFDLRRGASGPRYSRWVAGGTVLVKDVQTITFPSVGNLTYGDTFDPGATATSGEPVTYEIVSGPASVAGDSVTLTGVGDVVLRASHVGTIRYTAATASVTISPAKARLTVTAGNKSRAPGVVNPSFDYTITGYRFDDTVADISGSPALSCAADATSPPGTYAISAAIGTLSSTNYDFEFAPGVLTVGRAAQSITFPSVGPVQYGDGPLTLTATATSGLPVSYSVTGPATISNGVLTLNGAGSVVVTATQAGDATYDPASPQDQTIEVGKAPQSITFPAISPATFGDSPIALVATASSGLPVSFSVSGPGSVSNGVLTITGAGSIVVTAAQAGDGNYNPAAPQQRTLEVARASQTISFAPVGSKRYGDPLFPLVATASSLLAVTYSVVSGPATVTGDSVTLTGAGSVVLRASQSGNSDYAAATAEQTITVDKAVLTITAADHIRIFGASNPDFTTVVTGYVGSEDISVVSGAVPTPTTAATATSPAGTYAIVASASGLSATNYDFIAVNGTLTVLPTLVLADPGTMAPGATRTFSATGGSGTGYSYALVTNGSAGSIDAATGIYVAGRTGGATDVIAVTDSRGNTATLSVAIGPGVSLTPSMPSSPPRGTLGFAATGGSGVGYAYSIVTNASGASIDAATGGYTAGAITNVVDQVRVTDSLGNVATVGVQIGAGLSVNPPAPTVPPQGTIALAVSGGSGVGYELAIATNGSGGSIDDSGAYTAGPVGSTEDVIAVTDSLGNQATVTVTIGPGVTATAGRAALAPRGETNIAVSGGSGAGYSYAITTVGSGGTIDDQGRYVAGDLGEVTDVVTVTDSLGNLATATITITAAVHFVDPITTLPPRGAETFQVAGGAAGYVFALSENQSGGTIDPQTGAYHAGATGNAVDVITVTDANDATVSTAVSIGSGLVVTPAVTSVVPGETVELDVTGGSGEGYVWTLVAAPSGAEIDAATGTYVAGSVASSEKDIVEVEDSVGNTQRVELAVVEPDEDEDGVAADVDNCVDRANPDQADYDEDGVGDLCDADANADGFDDGFQLKGDGCAVAAGRPGGPGSTLLLVLVGAALLRRRRRAAATIVAVVGMSGGTLARADEVGTDFELERLTSSVDPWSVLGAESGAVEGHLVGNVGLVTSYSANPLVVVTSDAMGAERVGALVSARLGASLSAGVALRGRYALGLEIPLVLRQDEDLGATGTMPLTPSASGIGDARLLAKAQVLRSRTHGVDLAVTAALRVPTATSTDYLGDDGFGAEPGVAVSRRFGPARALLDVGYRLRPHNRAIDLDVDDELTGRLGGAYRRSLAASFVELGSAVQVARSASTTYAELLGGITYGRGAVQGTLGAGVGLSDGVGAPAWRALLGLRYAFAPTGTAARVAPTPDGIRTTSLADPPADSDGDQISDADDRCPADAEDHDQFEDGDGCVDADNDADGVVDLFDRCPEQAETRNALEDDDGCPDDPPVVVDPAPAPAVIEIVLPELLHHVAYAAAPVTAEPARRVAEYLQAHPEVTRLEVRGYASRGGDEADNEVIARRRAEYARAWLVDAGVAPERVVARGMGVDASAATREAARRVEFVIVATDAR